MMYDPERITFFAKTDARGQNVPFGIKAKDRTRHVYVIGKTGMGKSTLLENMAVQDMRNGEGLAFIDPHGQTAETLLNYVPEERVKDVLYFAPFDMEHPVSFNVMEDVGPDKRHLVVSGLMSVFKKIWVDAWSARMEYILSNTLLALLEYPDSTLLGVNRMLSDKEYRKRVVDNIKDPAVRSFWVDEFAKYNERYMQEAGDAIKNKTGQFTANPLIRNIIGQPKSSFDIRKIMDERKILIMNLSKGLVGETNANLLGSMLTTRIYLAAMSRADLPIEKLNRMPNFYFYVDEFQSFANATFANILSEARKYKLNLTIAHQYIEQMEEDVRAAVFGNVGTIVSFRVGPFDAEILETIFSPRFLAADIVNLGFAQVYLTLMIDGIGSPPFSAVTLPPIEPAKMSCKDMIIAASRATFSRPRAGVEQLIIDWHAPPRVVESVTKHTDAAATTASPRAPAAERSAPRTDRSAPPERTERNGALRTAGMEKSPRVERRPDRPTTPARDGRPNGKQAEHPGTRSGASVRDGAQAPRSTAPNLDELRAVLQKISATAGEPKNEVITPTPHVPRSRHEEKQTSATDTVAVVSTSLRDALAAVLHDTATPPPATSAPTPTTSAETMLSRVSRHEKNTRSTSPTNTAPADPSTEQEAVAPPPAERAAATTPADAGAPPVHLDDPLDPKKLERMMRLTNQDQSPFK